MEKVLVVDSDTATGLKAMATLMRAGYRMCIADDAFSALIVSTHQQPTLSMIFSRRPAAAVEAPDDQEEVDMLELDSVGPAFPLFDWFLIPHLGAPRVPHSTDQWAQKTATRLGGPVWFLDDRSALLVHDSAAEPEIVSDGHWLQFEANGLLVHSQ